MVVTGYLTKHTVKYRGDRIPYKNSVKYRDRCLPRKKYPRPEVDAVDSPKKYRALRQNVGRRSVAESAVGGSSSV